MSGLSNRVVVVGAGPAGCYAALALLKTTAFKDVHVFEKRPRNISSERGRNINITLCKRGMECLRSCDIQVAGHKSGSEQTAHCLKSIPMTYFKLHGQGRSLRLPYKDCIPSDMQQLSGRLDDDGSRAEPAINSVHRNELYYVLVDACEKAGVQFHFEHEYKSIEMIPETDRTDQMNVHRVHFESKDGSEVSTMAAIVVGADGVHSDVAKYITPEQEIVGYDKNTTVDMLLSRYGESRILENCLYGYRELTVPCEVVSEQGVELDTFHIWSAENMVVLGLPSPDGSVTVGVYGQTEKMKASSSALLIAEVVREFPELEKVLVVVPAAELDKSGDSYRIGSLQTLINPNFVKDGVVLVGDAAHAMLPFLGQGLNSGLEDTRVFLDHISEWTKAKNGVADVKSLHNLMGQFNTTRKADIHVIQEQSRCELERMLSLSNLVSHDVNPASFALSRFFYFAGFSTLPYGEAWKKSQPKKVLLGTTVQEGEILAQVESVKTLISVVAPCSGRVTGVKEKSHGVPEYEITPRTPSKADAAVDAQPGAAGTQTLKQRTSSKETTAQTSQMRTSSLVWDTQKDGATFKLPVFQAALKTSYIGRCMFYSEKTGSTMDDAKLLSDKGCIHGTACLSETMTAGRGRQGNTWSSPPRGNIYVTIVLKVHPDQEDQIKKVQFATAVAVCRAIRRANVEEAVLKWPNDVWVRGHKVAGVLIEVYRNAAVKDEDSDQACTAILVGVGINVNDNTRLNKNLREHATSVSNVIGQMASRETILADICNELEVQCDLEMETILEAFQSMHLWGPGSLVQVIPKEGATYRGVVEKIEKDGTLKITGDDGETKYLSDLGLSVRPVLKSSVYVYDGYGCSEQSLHMLYTSLKMHVDTSKYHVKQIGPKDLVEGSWTEDAALIAFGGGFDCGYIESLGDEGIRVVQKFVKEGGSYLGICAGGYFGCAEIEFDKDGPLSVCGQRDLGFFPGKCIGPVFPGFKYNSDDGAHAVEVTWKTSNNKEHGDTNLHSYFNGGGAFVFPQTDKGCDDVEILARYASIPDNIPAVLKCQVGAGTAVLSGVHFEYLPNDLCVTDDSPLVNVVPKLLASQEMSVRFFKSVLQHLSVY